MGWGPVDWVGMVLPEAKLENKTTLFFEIFWFVRPIARYLLKTILHCKGSRIWGNAITEVPPKTAALWFKCNCVWQGSNIWPCERAREGESAVIRQGRDYNWPSHNAAYLAVFWEHVASAKGKNHKWWFFAVAGKGVGWVKIERKFVHILEYKTQQNQHWTNETRQMCYNVCFMHFLGRKLLQNEPGGQTQKFSTFGFGTGEASLTHHSKIKFLIVFDSLLFWSFILSYTIQRELYVRKTINKNMIIFKWTSIGKSQPFCAS